MKVISVIVSFLLIASEARIVEFWQPRGDRLYSEESLTDSYGSPFVSSHEDIYEDSDVTERKRSLRTSYYEPNYGYSKATNKWKPVEQSVTKPKVKSKYSNNRNSAKYTAYGKPQQKPWKGFSFGSGQQYRQPKPVPAPVYGNRKKDHRSAQVLYDEGYQGPPPPPPPQHYTAQAPLVPFYHELQPKPSCGNRIVIGCTPKVTQVPCGYGAHLQTYQQPSYYHQSDVVGSPEPAPFPVDPQYLPDQPQPHGYNPLESPLPPPPAPNSGFSYQPTHEVPPPSHQLPIAPAGYSFNQPPPHEPTTKQPFPFNKHVSSFFQPKTTAKPSSSYAPPYQPTYKAPSEPSGFPLRSPPSFSHPVKEPTNETPHPAPHISAFPSTQPPTTSSTSSTTMAPRRLPTVPADRDQNYRVVIEDDVAAAAGNKESSGDEEPSSTVQPPTPTTHGHEEGHATTQAPPPA
ncbi:uncharacterized protein LOC120429753 [Culex pipiens pallens]|uniref:uncharacterized protein LOC120429753 n=1 Tax=Culex pipiens pallens TaxID=42434 RepID=UPI0019544C4A|nr:uncharacterized protein LOC120429753 [Culex pipiens pallens]